jgi:hypothetical protein
VTISGRESAVLRGELRARVDHLGLDRAAGQRPLADRLEVLAALADVDGDGDHVRAGPLGDPADRHRGVQAARVGEYHFVCLRCHELSPHLRICR